MAKTNEEKLLDVQEKIRHYKNQEKQILQQRKVEERNARTHRLVERGALLESLMGIGEDISNEQVRDLLAIALNSADTRSALLTLRQSTGSAKKAKVAPRGGT